jgi:hypothetical protein
MAFGLEAVNVGNIVSGYHLESTENRVLTVQKEHWKVLL